MTQSINISNNLPDLGAPFLYWDRNESDKASYCVETPYGFQLDLDFLKYVDDIQSGQTLKKMSLSRKLRSSRRSTSSLRSLSSQTGISVSTESLDYSEDGTSSDSVFFSRDVVDNSYSGAAKQALGLRKSNPISPTPFFKLLPPPPARSLLNARVEKALEGRKKQEQLIVDYEKSSNLSKLSSASRSSPNLTQGSLSTLQYNKGGDRRAVLSPTSTGSMKFSPVNSGRNTPADNSSSTHLQYIREQMAVSLKQLKDLEEQVKVIPLLQKQMYALEREKKQLTDELEKQRAYAIGMPSMANSGLHDIDLKKKLDAISENEIKTETITSKSEIRLESGLSKPSKITELKRLTEKLSDTERKSHEKAATDKTFVRYPAVKEKSRKSVSVGENIPMTESVFYYRSQREKKDAAVQYSTETSDVGVWVMEPLLGLTSEAEREIQILEHTIEHQRAVIKILENNLKAACDEMDELRVAVSTRTIINVQPNPVEASADANGPKPSEEYLQMVDTRALFAPEMSASGSDIELNRLDQFEDETVVDMMTEWKEISTHSKGQFKPGSNGFDTISVPISEHELAILGRDEVDSPDNKDIKCDISKKDIKDAETYATGAYAGEKNKAIMHPQSSEEVQEDNAGEDTDESRTLKSLDEVIMSCAQVLAS
ncbi:KN motif and ankyrin repeat domain-containing protein 1-like [Rana temporaria]|uniref:KN motif and ankyrin repeat domain-containing protein 1-like n=1 Tax=Rana temporaria TaxID=8407 RepID=UPI001AAD535F|nr:KN motif and ankyrin repeat domain-containing protein 1-like [Rana temporaria]